MKERRLIYRKGPDRPLHDGLLDNDKSPDDGIRTENDLDKSRLTEEERRQIDNDEKTPDDILKERNQKRTQAKNRLKEIARLNTENDTILSPREQELLEKRIDAIHSPTYLDDIIKEIGAIPDKKADSKEERTKVRSMEDSEIQDRITEYNSICDDNVSLIGTKQVQEFKNWFKTELAKKPTIEKAEDLITKLKGENSTDIGGLAPRRQTFNQLSKIFSNYSLGSPLKSDFIKREGLSERREFLKNVQDLEKHFQENKGTGFYSPAFIKKTMQEFLMAKDPKAQEKIHDEADKVEKREATSFIKMQESGLVGGIRVRKMSTESVQTLLNFYKDFSFTERMQTDFEKIAENELKLVQDLYKLYKDKGQTDLFASAVRGFSQLTYQKKEEDLKEHKKLLEDKENKEEVEKELTIKSAHIAIDQSAKKKDISHSTQNNYKKWFNKESNFVDPATGKAGDLKALKKAYEKLVDDVPDGEAKNLSAYAIKRKRYTKELQELKDVDPNVSDSEMKKWQDRYDAEGWTGRKAIYKDMKAEVEKKRENKAAIDKIAKAAGLDTDKLDENERNLKLNETINKAQELINEGQAAEALKVLLEYNDQDPDNPKIMFWIKTASDYMKEFGSGKKIGESAAKEIESGVDDAAQNAEFNEELKELQALSRTQKGIKQSETRHGEEISARSRAQKESEDSSSGEESELQDIVTDYYEGASKEKQDKILDSEGKSDDIHTIEMDQDMTSEELAALREKLIGDSGRMAKNAGITDIRMKDKSGDEMNADTIKSELDDRKEDLVNRMAEESEEKTAGKLGKSVFNIHEMAAAKRKAREITSKKEDEVIK